MSSPFFSRQVEPTVAAEAAFFKCFQCGRTALIRASSRLIPATDTIIPISQMKKQRPIQGNLLMTLPVTPMLDPRQIKGRKNCTHVLEALLTTEKMWGNLRPSADGQTDEHGVAMG